MGTIYVLATKQMQDTLHACGCVPRKETSGLSFAESNGRKDSSSQCFDKHCSTRAAAPLSRQRERLCCPAGMLEEMP